MDVKVYLASPFFNEKQIKVVENLENLISKFSTFNLYSPRKDGVLLKMSPEEKAKSANRIFQLNIANMTTSKLIVAVIDGRDVGVTWELGYCYGIRLLKNNKIVTYSEEGHGVNVMIKESVDAHCQGMDQMETVLKAIHENRWGVLSEFRNFNPKVY